MNKPSKMNAVIWTTYGPADLLKVQQVEIPQPQAHQVLVKIHAATVTAGDCELRRFDIQPWIWLPVRLIMGIRKPRNPILGQEFAGVVVAMGEKVTEFEVGDQVFGGTGITMGAYAEYLAISAQGPIAKKPDSMSLEEAATIPTGGLNALHFIRKAELKQGQSILINGAGGSIGTYAVQLAKSQGAEVTAVDNTKKLEMLRSLGADFVIDYQQEDFTKNGKTYDVIFDIACKGPYSDAVNSVKKQGRYLIGNPSFTHMMRGLWTSWTTSKNVIFALAGEKIEDLLYLKELAEAGTIRSVIDKRYNLSQIVDAHHYVEQGKKSGNLILTISS